MNRWKHQIELVKSCTRWRTEATQTQRVLDQAQLGTKVLKRWCKNRRSIGGPIEAIITLSPIMAADKLAAISVRVVRAIPRHSSCRSELGFCTSLRMRAHVFHTKSLHDLPIVRIYFHLKPRVRPCVRADVFHFNRSVFRRVVSTHVPTSGSSRQNTSWGSIFSSEANTYN